jgi:HEAT repeat protein
MKRTAPIIVGVMAVAVLVTGTYYAVKALIPPPLSVAEMEKLQENPELAVREIPRLIECLDYNNADIRLNAALALSKAGAKAVDPVRAKLNADDAKVRFCAVETLAWIGPDAAPAANDVVPLLTDSNSEVRFKSAYALGKFGVANDAVIVGLVKAIGDSNKDASNAAIDALGMLGREASVKVYQLAAKDKLIPRDRLMPALTKMGKPPAEAVPVLIELVDDERQRGQALMLLGQVGEPAIPAFRELLKKPYKRHEMIHAVAQLGKDAKQLLPELETLLTNPGKHDVLEPELLGIFKQCGPDGAKPLANALKAQADIGHRGRILTAIGELGPQSKDAVPTLIELLITSPPLQPQILQTLGDIGPAARAAIPAVEALTTDPALGKQAKTALRRMGVFPSKAETPKADK